jgi:hypothetical protein
MEEDFGSRVLSSTHGDLSWLTRKFDPVTGSGLFPALPDENRPFFADNPPARGAFIPHGGGYGTNRRPE